MFYLTENTSVIQPCDFLFIYFFLKKAVSNKCLKGVYRGCEILNIIRPNRTHHFHSLIVFIIVLLQTLRKIVLILKISGDNSHVYMDTFCFSQNEINLIDESEHSRI